MSPRQGGSQAGGWAAGIEPRVCADAQALAHAAAQWLVETVAASAGPVAICLAGGSTPRRLYELLAGDEFSGRLPWARTHWFLGDERFVPPDDPQSNARMARMALLDHVPVPAGNVHAVPTVGLTPQESAAAYERELRGFYGAEELHPDRPLFAVTLLGLGEDGHIASLFPGTDALQERERWAVAVTGVKAEARISLTYPVLESSGAIAFLVSGASKRDVLARLAAGEDLPAARLAPRGRAMLFADRDAMPDGGMASGG